MPQTDRHGSTVEDRFWRYTVRDPDTECWWWTGAVQDTGYGVFWPGQGSRYAHRFAYEMLVGPIPAGLDLDHLCRNRLCVNPAHLEPVTRKENIDRSPISPAAINARKTECIRGHAFAGPNLRIRPCGRRSCIACERIRAGERAA